MSEQNEKNQLKESFLQQEAFEFYYELGDTRTLQLVADKFERHVQTVKTWSSELGWQRRIEERTRRIAEVAKTEIDKTIVQNRKVYKSTTQAILAELNNRFAKAIENNKLSDIPLKVESLQDLERLIKMDVLMLSTVEDLTKLGLDETKIMKEAKLKAILVLTQLMSSGNEHVRQRAAKDLLEYMKSSQFVDETSIPQEFETMSDEDVITYLNTTIANNPELNREITEHFTKIGADILSANDTSLSGKDKQGSDNIL